MPKRTDIQSILIIGSGPIVIGQGCEFDYAGTQAGIALKKEGYRIILINPNPATIMTDCELADVTYMEPLTEEFIIKIIEQEQPDALLPTVGGQTALNIAVSLAKKGILARHNVELIGTSEHSIEIAENRFLFKNKMLEIGLNVPESYAAKNIFEACYTADNIGYPILILNSFALGGIGSSVINNCDELKNICEKLWEHRADHIIILSKYLFGWKEFELEVIRDSAGNCIVVCGIENINPLGVHTGDSITVAPVMTLTDKEYQQMRNSAFAVMSAVGVTTGGANVQFAVNPKTGEILVIEMNPRVSRSSALASKATGYPIAKVAALLAVGYTLNELKSDMLGGKIPASFEPVLDYVVVKMPRFDFEKFPKVKDVLGTQMQSIGEVMGVGRTFKQALQKAICSLEINRLGLEKLLNDKNEIIKLLMLPNSNQLWAIADAIRLGLDLEKIYQLTGIDRWFLFQIRELVNLELDIKNNVQENLYQYKKNGFTDQYLATLIQCSEYEIQTLRKQQNIKPAYKRIDSCAAEFFTSIPCMYSCYKDECESNPTALKKVVIIGSGPNRIGQGIEFDYCCVQAIKSLCELGYETIIINSNPETVSTDFTMVDRLYFSPLIVEEIFAILEIEKPIGILLQFGGQTPLNLAKKFLTCETPILGLTAKQIEISENRQKFNHFLDCLGIPHATSISLDSKNIDGSLNLLQSISFPVIIRPSFVIGGNKIQLITHSEQLFECLEQSVQPVLVEEYLTDAIEVDIDAICDGHEVFIPAIMENIEPVGIHSGDSFCSIPPIRLNNKIQNLLIDYTRQIALKLDIIGLINIQFAVKKDKVYVLEVNPRASRTVPFVSKTCGINLVKTAMQCIMGKTLREQNLPRINLDFYSIKKPIFSDKHFPNFSLGPEMKSTGEVMAIGATFSEAYQKLSRSPSNYVQKTYSLRSLQCLHKTSELI